MHFTKSSLLLLLCLWLTHSSWAQKKPMKWGKISNEHAKLSEYAADPDAAAIVLGDYGEANFEVHQNDLKLTYTRHKRIKILSTVGLEAAEIAIPYYAKDRVEKIIEFKAQTHNEVGNGKFKAQKVGKKDVFEEEIDDRWVAKKFSFPNVEVGSIVEYQYKIVTEDFLDFKDWYFQSNIPTLWSEFRVRIPEYFKYLQRFQGTHALAINESKRYQEKLDFKVESRIIAGTGGGRTGGYTNTYDFSGDDFRYVAKDVPALRPEAYTSNITDYRSMVDFQLQQTHFPNSLPDLHFTTWENLNDRLLKMENFGMQLNRNKKIKKKAKEIVKNASSDQEKIIQLYDHVRKSMTWNGYDGTTASQNLSNVYEAKTGRGSDINLILTIMLRAVNIKANPVLISTRSNGKVLDIYPIVNQFNHTLVYAQTGDKSYLLDATDPERSYNLLPKDALNGKGFMIDKKNPGWVDIQAKKSARHVASAEVTLQADGSLTGSLKCSDSGHNGFEVRKTYLKDGEKTFTENKFTKPLPTAEVSSFSVDNQDKIDKPFKTNYEFQIPDFAATLGDKLYIAPMLTEAITENPFKLKERSFPVNFAYPRTWQYMLNLVLPEGYTVDELPKGESVKLENGAGSFTFVAQMMGENRLQLASTVKIKQIEFLPEEYPYIKEFFDRIVAKHAEKIAFKKK